MALNEETKVKIRHHLGYLQVIQAQSYALGIPASLPTQFAVEGAMDKVAPSAVARLLSLIAILDGIEDQIVCDQDLLATTKVGDISIREDEFEKLMRQYKHWQGALANLLSVVPNPADQRFVSLVGRTGLNCPVLE